MTVHLGCEHDYLGMVIDYAQKRKANVSIKEYVNRMLKKCPKEFQEDARTPATKHMFEKND